MRASALDSFGLMEGNILLVSPIFGRLGRPFALSGIGGRFELNFICVSVYGCGWKMLAVASNDLSLLNADDCVAPKLLLRDPTELAPSGL